MRLRPECCRLQQWPLTAMECICFLCRCLPLLHRFSEVLGHECACFPTVYICCDAKRCGHTKQMHAKTKVNVTHRALT